MAEKVTLTNMRIRGLFNALQQMDGRVKLATDSNGRSAFVQETFDLDGNTIMTLAENQIRLEPIVRAMDKAQRAIQGKETSNGELEEFLLQEREVEIIKLPKASVKAGDNKLAPSTLVGLKPMFTDELVS